MVKSENFSGKNKLSPAKRALLEKWKRGELKENTEAQVIQRYPERDSLPLSFAQQRLWFLDQLEGGSATYNVPAAMRLSGSLQVVALEQAIGEIVQRHEVLRTSFPMVNQSPVQAIAPCLSVTLPIVDLQLPELEQSALVQRLAHEEATRPFDLSHGPLLRVTLLRLEEKTHVLLVTMHHIVSDGWSIGIFIRELSALYQAFSTVAPSPLPELPIQYADFAHWQRQWLSGEVLETQLNYWKQQLAGAPPILELPTDRSRPLVQTSRGSAEPFKLNPHLTRRLLTLSQQSGTTLFMTLLAAFVTLLSRYSSQEDIVVGSPIANRHRREIEPLIGFFVNTLVLRTNVKGNPSFSELLTRVRQVALDAYAHQDLPFEQLVETLQPERSLSHNPLFQVMFVLQNASMGKLELPGLTLTPLEMSSVTAKFDLTLAMSETEQGLQGVWEYNTDLFEAATIRRMVGHFQTLLQGIVSNPQQHIQELPLLTDADRHQLLVKWNGAQVEYPQNKCIHQLFEEQVERTPEAVAVVFEDQQLTYRELNYRANQLAHYLQALGVKPEVLVGISVERSLEMVIGLLGILKAGGVYVPLDPAYPKESLAFMLSDAQVPVLVTQNQLVESLPEQDGHIVCLDTDWEAIAQHTQDNPASCVIADNLAYVMYTSGSTGKPKGVSIIHRGVVRLVKGSNYVNLSAEEVLLQLAPISFDAATFEIWGSLLNGGRLVVMPAHTPSLQELGQALRQYHITTLWLSAGLFHLMVDEQLDDLKQVRQLLAGGDILSVPHVHKVVEQLPRLRLVNGYGPTENTTFTCCYSICPPDRSEAIAQPREVETSVPIGRPITNTQVYLLDQYLQPVPIGVVGELHIAGVGLARSYFRRPELTASRFIPNPFSAQEGSRLYKTGDLARYLPDGNIEFLGRGDNQVKIRGFRIELAEIEAVLSQHPNVRKTVVIAREDHPGNKRLVGYVISNQESLTATELRQFLKQKLPEYMLPSAIVMLDALPLTPNGKVDRRALPAPDLSYLSLETSFVPPRNSTEDILAAIWTEVLGIEQVGIYDNFFELGGDSILSIQIIARANQAGFQLSPKQLFGHQTIAELATVAADTTHAMQVEQGLVTGLLPLTPIQHWFFEQNLPESHHWNQAFLLEVQPGLNPDILERVVQHLLVHHDALRLCFVRSNSDWQQINTAPARTTPFSLVDLSALPEAEQGGVIEATAAELQTTLNLSDGPIVQVAFLSLGSDTSRLLIVIHHLAVDGVSWRILLEDLETAYQQLSQGKTIALPPKTTSFKHWAERLSFYAQSNALESELAYWLAESWEHVPSLPVDYAGGANTEASVHTVSISLNVEETCALLQEVPKAYNTQINDVLLTALLQVFAKWTGFNFLLLNLEGHGREDIFEDVDLSRTVGWFTAIFPMLLKLEAVDNLGDALKSVKEQLRQIPNKGIGYGLLRYLSGDAEIAAKLQSFPQAEVSFNYLGQFDQLLHTSTLFQPAQEPIGASHSLRGSRNHLLDINGLIVGKQLRINWTYSENFHQRATVESLAQAFLQALRSLISHCLSPEAGGCTPSDFPLASLNQDELDRALRSIELDEDIIKTNWKNIEELYPLSPMQQGMLFHTLYAPEAGVYFVQLSCTLQGNLEVRAFQQAWQQVIARHLVLRTAFIWEHQDKPLQIVYRQVKLPLEIHDWRELSPVEQQQQLEIFLQCDREQGFKLSQAPLMRLTLIQLKQDVYQFVWSFHHLLMDGWSLHLVLKEVFAFYKASYQYKNLYLDTTYSYRDYIAWLQKQNLAKAELFWRQALKGFTAPTPLVLDRTLTNLPSDTHYSEQQIQLSVTTTEALQSLARQHQLTLNTLVQGAWALLLSRYSGEADVVFGVTVAGRPPAIRGVESTVGLFINTLPIRVQVSDKDSLLSWLKQIQNQQVEMSQYEYSSLVQIHEWSEIPRGLPLFESIVVFENYPMDASLRERSGNLELSDVRAFERTNYPLTVVAVPGTELSLQLKYDCHRFDAGTIARMLGHLKTLLKEMVVNPPQRLSSLPMLSAAEKQQLLEEWNDTTTDYPQDRCIHQLFEAQVERTPDAVAVVFEDESLTYRELNTRANQLAHYLVALGVKPEVLVGICTERSLEIMVGLLGILKAGGAYVPLDPAYPQERLAFILEDAQVSVLLTQQHLVEKLPKHGAHLVCLDEQWHSIAQHAQQNPQSAVALENLVYAIYTSGSTGKPKGVAVSHKNLLNLVFWHQQAFSVSPTDRATQIATAAFDACGWEVWPYLAAGASIYFVDDQTRSSPTQLQDWLLEQDITISFLPTPLAERVLALSWPFECALRTLLTGGDKLQQHPGISLPFAVVNNYGPTENTVVTTSGVVAATEQASGAPTIGRPITNTQVYLLDQHLQPVPIGIVGELYIGGTSLARGYLNQKELTALAFIPNPFSNEPGARLYKTGDLARYLPDSNIEYLDRSDNQVKIRGFRIELAEIEAVVSQHPDVLQSLVIAREDIAGDKYLVAYVVPQQETSPTMSELRRFLKQQLPEYMVPRTFVMLDTLPLTANGKVDRRSLPVPEMARPELESTFVAPKTPVQEILAAIWTEVLGIEQVGIEDNFFELGGHSLLATQLVSRVRTTFGVELPLRSAFEAPTVLELAECIETTLKRGQQLLAPPLLPRTQNQPLPLSFAQQRLWFLDQLQPNSGFYNIPVVVRLEGKLNVVALEQSLNEIISRHEALRTNFITLEGEPVQVIAQTRNLRLSFVNLCSLPEAATESECQRLATQEAVRPFNLATEPLVRATLLQLKDTEHLFLLIIHHIVADGWSLGVLIRELAALYEGFCTQKPSNLPQLPIQYADFAIWQRQWLQGEVLEAQLSYWKQQLCDAPAVLELPTDRPRTAVQTFRGAHQSFALPLELSHAVRNLSQRCGTTLFMTLLGVFFTLLYRYSGQSDICVGTPIANRNFSQIEGLIGFFVNTLVLRTNLGGNCRFSDVLSQVREVTLEAYAHQDVPFEQLVEELQPARDLSRTPLFQVMFVLQNAPMSSLEFSDLTVSPVTVESSGAKFDLTLSLENTEQGLLGSWEYNTDLFDDTTIARMAGHFQTLLEGIVANPQQKLSQLPLLSGDEQQQLLVEWNDTQANCPVDICIHQLFEAAVERTPNAIALVFEDEQLTYWELNIRANQLAHYLQALGVQPEVLVGICTERSLEMIVGLLGILKAGGAYVPLDPAYPQERLAFMLEDAQVSVLLTQQHLAERLAGYGEAHLVCLDEQWHNIAQQPQHNPESAVALENLVYAIYTSGSTGKPKGVAVSHKSLLNLVFWHQQAFSVSPQDRATQIATAAFDACGWEVWPYLATGASIYFVDDQIRSSPTQLQDWLLEQGITISFLPTPLAERILALDWSQESALRTLLTGGDKLQQHPQVNLPFTVVNNYGPTENTVVTTSGVVAATEETVGVPTIGRAIANTQVYLLDQYLQPVPIGVVGELYIGGASLARGYLNRPELTAQAFIPNPFSNEPNFRLYKTGDLARYLPNGNIEYFGRCDNQVKLRGLRIELGEIEAVLSQHPDVLQSVVIIREDIVNEQRLVAYLVGQQQTELTSTALRRFLKQQLPEYMVPSAFVILDTLPLTPNGKVNRRALPAPNQVQSDLRDAFVAPRDSLELELAQIWEDLLKVSPIGVMDNFFDLGGHSLLAVRLIAQIQKQFGQDLPLTSLFQGATIDQLAKILRQQIDSPREEVDSSGWSPLVAIQPNGSQRPFFCVHPAGGNVLCYYDLARCLGSDQPFYAFQAKGVDGKQDPHTTVQDMAACYIKALRVIQPEGPYLLGGWSFGGLVAFEMALQLQAQGQQVELLALLDSSPIVDQGPLEEDDAVIVARLFQQFHSISFKSPRQLPADEQLLYVIKRLKWTRLLPSNFDLAQARSFLQIHKLNNRAAQNYVPKHYPGRVTLFQAAEHSAEIAGGLTMGWDKFAAKGVDLHIVPGKHLTLLSKPNVQVLAERLKRCIGLPQTEALMTNYLEIPVVGKKISHPLRWVVGLMTASVLVIGTTTTYTLINRGSSKEDIAALTIPVEAKNVTLRMTASGNVVPIQNVNISPKNPGTLTDLYVEQGYRVKQGQIIARMDSANIQAQILQYRANLAQAQAQLAEAQAGNRPQEIAQARARLVQAEAQLAEAQAGNRPQEIAQAQAQVDAVRAKVDFTSKRLKRYQDLYQQGAVKQIELDQYISEDKSSIADLEQAQKRLSLLQSGSRSEEIAKQKAATEEARAALDLLENGTRPEVIAQRKAGVAAAIAQLKAAQVQLEDTIIRAPFSGIVTQKYANIGAFVTPTTSASSSASATSSSIVGIAHGLEILANVPEVDIGRIKEGQHVEIAADAYPEQVFKGRVRLIAPEAVKEEGVTLFQVRLAIDTGQEKLRSGLNVDLTFLGDKVQDALLLPTVAIVTEKGNTGVLVPDANNKPQFRPVTVGAQIKDQTQILLGVKQGDRVFVNPPADYKIQQRQEQQQK